MVVGVYQNCHFNVVVKTQNFASLQSDWGKLLMLGILGAIANIETRHATSLLMAKSHFDTPSTATLE